jgi:hypothetical protein
VISEAPFLFSMAALNASMAGLAGLVVGLRRGSDMSPHDSFRLRQIVEFAFANVLLTVIVIPLEFFTDDLGASVRIGAAIALAYLLVNNLVMLRRLRSHGLEMSGSSYWIILVLNVLMLLAILGTLWTGSFAMYALLLILFLARPMLAFLFVLQSFERT